MTTGQVKQNPTAVSKWPLIHERGGLELDVSAFDGLVKITGGATSAVTVTAAAEGFLDDVDVRAQRGTLGLATTTDDNRFIRASGANGETQNSLVDCDDAGNVTGINNIGINGDVTFGQDTTTFRRSGKNAIRLTCTALDVNFLDLYSGQTTVGPWLVADGTDANIDIDLQGKGTGIVRVYNNAALREVVTITGAQAISGKTQLDVDNLRLDGNTLSSTDANGDLNFDTNGTGETIFKLGGSEKARIDSDGRLGINITDMSALPSVSFINVLNEATHAQFNLVVASNNPIHNAGLKYRKSRGTWAAKVKVEDGDKVGAFSTAGWDGAAWKHTASINFIVDGATAAGVVPVALDFRTGSPVSAIRLTIHSDGDILVDTDGKLMFRDSTLFVQSSANGQLDIDADVEVEITAPTIDLVASTAVVISGAVMAAGLKSGVDQAGAGAAANELYVDTNDDNTVKRGV